MFKLSSARDVRATSKLAPQRVETPDVRNNVFFEFNLNEHFRPCTVQLRTAATVGSSYIYVGNYFHRTLNYISVVVLRMYVILWENNKITHMNGLCRITVTTNPVSKRSSQRLLRTNQV